MAKTRKPTRFLNTKLMAKFLRDYRKMPYKTKSVIMAAVLVVLLIPLALIYPLDPTPSTPLDRAPLEVSSPPTDCVITGCANHLCLDTPIDAPADSCYQPPQFQCLRYAKCELQPSGRCGWTDTPEYLNCLSIIDTD
jgi:hypothetical protein